MIPKDLLELYSLKRELDAARRTQEDAKSNLDLANDLVYAADRVVYDLEDSIDQLAKRLNTNGIEIKI